MIRTARLISFLLLMFVMASLLTGCGATLADVAKLEQYEMGDDAIPSVTSVVGERSVSSVKSSINNGVTTKEYTYSSDSVYDDLLAYIVKLMDEGWLVTKDIDLNVVPSSGELGRESVEEGQIVLLTFTYDDDGYVITVTKGIGTIE